MYDSRRGLYYFHAATCRAPPDAQRTPAVFRRDESRGDKGLEMADGTKLPPAECSTRDCAEQAISFGQNAALDSSEHDEFGRDTFVMFFD